MSEVVDNLRAIVDPIARAKACQVFITNGRSTIRTVQRMRDEAIREARPKWSIDALAAATGCRRNVVVDALRGGAS